MAPSGSGWKPTNTDTTTTTTTTTSSSSSSSSAADLDPFTRIIASISTLPPVSSPRTLPSAGSNTPASLSSPSPASYRRSPRLPTSSSWSLFASTPSAPIPPRPDPYDRDISSKHKRFSHRPNSVSSRLMGTSYSWWRFKRLLTKPLPWALLLLIACITWWTSGATQELKSADLQMRLRDLFPPEFTRDLQFFPASNHKIHADVGTDEQQQYVGRWTTAPNRLRIDGAFPGAYFDLNVTNTSSLVLSLQNTKPDAPKPTVLTDTQLQDQPMQPESHFSQYAFGAASKSAGVAPPISLLALVDQEEYVVLPNASSLVPVRMKDLDSRVWHIIRVIAPMTDDDGRGMMQIDGLWLDKGGSLSPVEGSTAAGNVNDEDDLDPDSAEVGKLHRLGLSSLLHRYNRGPSHSDSREDGDAPEFRRRRKLIEIVTDQAAHLTSVKSSSRNNGADGLLAGVMGWEYLLGEMFSVDHVCVGLEGMCLVHDCIGGTGEPNGMGDVFFRSGPAGSPHYSHPWPFQSYVPDVMIFNLGASDFYSFENHAQEYNRTRVDLLRSFEDTYVSLVKAVRNLAYPTHPSILEAQRLGLDSDIDFDAPGTIPIFIMRPFNGELEHATQSAVNRLRSEGDKSVFWLDTTGWLETEDTETTQSDFFMDPDELDSHPHLTERGNQKVAIYLHMHVCRFLATETNLCPFLPPEVYQGNVYDPGVATFDRYIENEKERQMREVFWGDHLRDL